MPLSEAHIASRIASLREEIVVLSKCHNANYAATAKLPAEVLVMVFECLSRAPIPISAKDTSPFNRRKAACKPDPGTPSLPWELLTEILLYVRDQDDLAIERSDPTTGYDTCLDLPSCLLVSRHWHAVASPLLFASIVASEGATKSFARFIEFLATSPRVAAFVRSLKLKAQLPLPPGRVAVISATVLGEILAHLPALLNLQLENIRLKPSSPVGSIPLSPSSQSLPPISVPPETNNHRLLFDWRTFLKLPRRRTRAESPHPQDTQHEERVRVHLQRLVFSQVSVQEMHIAELASIAD